MYLSVLRCFLLIKRCDSEIDLIFYLIDIFFSFLSVFTKKTPNIFIFVKITYSLGEPYIWPFNFIVKPQLHSNYYYTNWTRPFWGHFPILYELRSTAATSRNAVTIYCRVSILHMGYLVYILLTEYAKIPLYNNISTRWWGR